MRFGRSGENILRYLAGHVRQAEVASTIVIRQTFVIQAHGTKDRRMKIVNVHGVLYGLQPEFVSSPVSGSTLDASTSHTVKPNGLWSRPFCTGVT